MNKKNNYNFREIVFQILIILISFSLPFIYYNTFIDNN
jgi:hypothetical protein